MSGGDHHGEEDCGRGATATRGILWPARPCVAQISWRTRRVVAGLCLSLIGGLDVPTRQHSERWQSHSTAEPQHSRATAQQSHSTAEPQPAELVSKLVWRVCVHRKFQVSQGLLQGDGGTSWSRLAATCCGHCFALVTPTAWRA